jgi:catechol 2,3-dioxygenase-like lactoylglutathione lyase family enzyme
MKLYFVELQVSDWAASLTWYREVLGLDVLLTDEPARFALLRAGQTRLSLKAGTPTPGGVLLSFEVEDLSPWLGRLGLLDVKTSPEGYRRARLRDPDGYTITLFEWLPNVTRAASAE